jgi:predicted glycosyltransferase
MDASGAPWLIYALGGGWGHLTRAAALARAAAAECRVRILTNSPYAEQVHRAMPALDLLAIDPALSAPDTRLETVRQIRAASPACLIVDTFPRGLGGELAGVLHSLAPCKVLIHRDLDPRYVAEAGLLAFVESAYDLILIPGEAEGHAFADLPASVVTAPWLIRSPSELPPRQTGGQPCIVVCASGRDEELAWYGSVVAELLLHSEAVAVRCIAASCPPGCPREYWIAHWPAADLYAQADVVVGGAGYNTIHECLAYGIPLIARPWPRTYDRQWLRAQQAAQRGSVTAVEHPEEAALAAIHQLSIARQPPAEFRNGAEEAVALILRATQSACAPDPRSL